MMARTILAINASLLHTLPLGAHEPMLALNAVMQKWRPVNAQFGGVLQKDRATADALTQTLEVDGVEELILDGQSHLRVQEWVHLQGDERANLRPVDHLRGLPFPRRFRRANGSRD